MRRTVLVLCLAVVAAVGSGMPSAHAAKRLSDREMGAVRGGMGCVQWWHNCACTNLVQGCPMGVTCGIPFQCPLTGQQEYRNETVIAYYTCKGSLSWGDSCDDQVHEYPCARVDHYSDQFCLTGFLHTFSVTPHKGCP